MGTAVGVIGFIVLVAIVHWARIALNDVVARGVDGLVSQATSSRPNVWSISPGSVSAGDLQAALRGAGSSVEFGGTAFTVSMRGGEPVLQCSTPAAANLGSARTAILHKARQVDPACQLQL